MINFELCTCLKIFSQWRGREEGFEYVSVSAWPEEEMARYGAERDRKLRD